ncbi:MarR family winged helix-turn-helix transcriptional regulator [Peptoniphilus stercorisuis]|uniref:DNA-binding MarR family transcriptional regulator n=1 Tax=Peptoniphilus stercorisuis TaxID=1436965 RepID=A0ABS4KE29_9FIRM|nr:MarR family transcriptional regulator [Peptoniphilus stercorisuis]MBP2026000.1 DNA-binding MarR family transcriptional regulator [Peptoniphilus stercorisuis]
MIDKKLYSEIRKINNIMRNISHNSLSQDLNLSHAQINILEIINSNPGIIQKEIASIINIKASSMTELVSKLKNKDLIYRKKDDTDLRIIRLFITDKGKEELKNITKIRDENEKSIFKSLNEDEKENLYSLLKKINESL